MGVNYLFDTPIYWQLPKQFLGDRVRPAYCLPRASRVLAAPSAPTDRSPFSPSGAVVRWLPALHCRDRGRLHALPAGRVRLVPTDPATGERPPRAGALPGQGQQGRPLRSPVRRHCRLALWLAKAHQGPPSERDSRWLSCRRLHHSLWRAKNNATSKVTREQLMLALQSVQHVLIRATDSIDFSKAV